MGTYNSQETEESKWLWQVKSQLEEEFVPLSGAVAIKVEFFMPRPKSHYGTGKNSGILKKTAPISHTKKPDIDNLLKLVYDCLNRVAWKDDSCIFECYAKKQYSETPRTEITISEALVDESRARA